MAVVFQQLAPIPSGFKGFAPALAAHTARDVQHIPVLMKTMAPLRKTLSLHLPITLTADEILASVVSRLNLHEEGASLLRLTTPGGHPFSASSTLADLTRPEAPRSFVELEIRLAVLGGKGGFGSMLRAQGGKMSARKGEENNDSCRDLNGRRLSTVKEAKALAAYLAEAPAREAALSKAQSEKYAKLEKMLGRKPRSAKDFEEAANKLDDAGGDLGAGEEDGGAGPSNVVPVRGREAQGSGVAGGSGAKRERFEVDNKYIEESREAVDKAKSAVAIAMAKKKKKAAAAAAAAQSSSADSGSKAPTATAA